MIVTFVIALGVLEAWLFLIGPVLQSEAMYVALKIMTILMFSFVCARIHKKSLYGVLSGAGLLIFLDQVLFKSIYLWWDFRKNPAAWAGVDPLGAIYASAFSYIVFLPVVLILAFVGAFAGSYSRDRKNPGT
jgi:hypothetical protein